MSSTPEDPFARSADDGDSQSSAPQPEAWGEPTPQAQPSHTPPPPPYGQEQQAQPQYAQQPQYDQAQYAQQPQYGQPQYAQQPQYGQPQYAQPGYPQPYGGPNPAQAKNWMGIVSLVASVSTILTGIGCVVGIVFGHLALNAVKKGEADNRGLALGGLITGYVFLGIGLLGIAAYIAFFAVLFASTPSSY